MNISGDVESILQKLLANWEKDHVGDPYFGVTDGDLGIALYYAWLGKKRSSDEYAEKVIDLVNLTISSLNNNVRSSPLTFGAGLSGLGWFLVHLEESGMLDAGDNLEMLEEIDLIVMQFIQVYIASNNFDHVKGANGLLFYLLKRKKLDANVVESIFCEKSIDGSGNISYRWWFAKTTIDDQEMVGMDLGVPHGICGTLLLLLKCREALACKVDEVIDHTIQFMFSNIHRTPDGILFPGWSNLDRTKISPGNTGWCSGNLSVAYAALLAGDMLKNGSYTQLGHELLAFPVNLTGIKDNTLCHGVISAAHMFYRIFLLTGDEQYKVKYMECKGMAVNSFLRDFASYEGKGKNSFYFENASLLYGFSGFALSLFCIDNNLVPTWDESLLL